MAVFKNMKNGLAIPVTEIFHVWHGKPPYSDYDYFLLNLFFLSSAQKAL